MSNCVLSFPLLPNLVILLPAPPRLFHVCSVVLFCPPPGVCYCRIVPCGGAVIASVSITTHTGQHRSTACSRAATPSYCPGYNCLSCGHRPCFIPETWGMRSQPLTSFVRPQGCHFLSPEWHHFGDCGCRRCSTWNTPQPVMCVSHCFFFFCSCGTADSGACCQTVPDLHRRREDLLRLSVGAPAGGWSMPCPRRPTHDGSQAPSTTWNCLCATSVPLSRPCRIGWDGLCVMMLLLQRYSWDDRHCTCVQQLHVWTCAPTIWTH